jgi:hypothetical protein
MAAADEPAGNAPSQENFDAELDAMRTCAIALEQLTDDAKGRTLQWLIERYSHASARDLGKEATAALSRTVGVPGTSASSGSGLTPKRFVQEKSPRTDVERIAVLAYYLANYRDIEHFKTADLTALNTEAAQRRLSNAADAASNATKSSGFLADAGKGMRQLTAKGEEAVEALPDREALKAVMARHASPRRRRSARGDRSKAQE